MARTTQSQGPQATSLAIGTNRNQGFALVSLLFLIPVAFVILSGIAVMAMSLRNYTLAYASCRRAVWLAQIDMGKALTQLLKLNPEARRLRLQRKITETELKAAKITLQAELIAALQAQRAMIMAQQLRLRQQQTHLLFQAGLRRAQAARDLIFNAQVVRAHEVKASSLTANLAVYFTPALDPSPDAVTVPRFEKMQKLKLTWTADLLAQIPSVLINTLKIKPLTLTGQCAATLEKEGFKWQTQLIADKF